MCQAFRGPATQVVPTAGLNDHRLQIPEGQLEVIPRNKWAGTAVLATCLCTLMAPSRPRVSFPQINSGTRTLEPLLAWKIHWGLGRPPFKVNVPSLLVCAHIQCRWLQLSSGFLLKGPGYKTGPGPTGYHVGLPRHLTPAALYPPAEQLEHSCQTSLSSGFPRSLLVQASLKSVK